MYVTYAWCYVPCSKYVAMSRMRTYYIPFEHVTQPAKKLVSPLAISRTACVKSRSKEQNLATTYVTMIPTISSLESSCLAICMQPTTCKCPLLPVFFVQSAQEVEFVPVATVMTDVHRYCLPVAFTARSSEMQLSMSGGQIVSCDLPLRTYGHTS